MHMSRGGGTARRGVAHVLANRFTLDDGTLLQEPSHAGGVGVLK